MPKKIIENTSSDLEGGYSSYQENITKQGPRPTAKQYKRIPPLPSKSSRKRCCIALGIILVGGLAAGLAGGAYLLYQSLNSQANPEESMPSTSALKTTAATTALTTATEIISTTVGIVTTSLPLLGMLLPNQTQEPITLHIFENGGNLTEFVHRKLPHVKPSHVLIMKFEGVNYEGSSTLRGRFSALHDAKLYYNKPWPETQPRKIIIDHVVKYDLALDDVHPVQFWLEPFPLEPLPQPKLRLKQGETAESFLKRADADFEIKPNYKYEIKLTDSNKTSTQIIYGRDLHKIRLSPDLQSFRIAEINPNTNEYNHYSRSFNIGKPDPSPKGKKHTKRDNNYKFQFYDKTKNRDQNNHQKFNSGR